MDKIRILFKKDDMRDPDLDADLFRTTRLPEVLTFVATHYGTQSSNLQLFHRGVELCDTNIIIGDYFKTDGEIVVVKERKKRRPRLSRSKKDVTKTEKTTGQTAIETLQKHELIDTLSQAYSVGDPVDVRIENAWFEGSVVKVFMANVACSSSSITTEEALIFNVISEPHVQPPFDRNFAYTDIRPRSYFIYKITDVKKNMVVMANINLIDVRKRGNWYDCTILNVADKFVTVTLNITGDYCRTKFVNELYRIEFPRRTVNIETRMEYIHAPSKQTSSSEVFEQSHVLTVQAEVHRASSPSAEVSAELSNDENKAIIPTMPNTADVPKKKATDLLSSLDLIEVLSEDEGPKISKDQKPSEEISVLQLGVDTEKISLQETLQTSPSKDLPSEDIHEVSTDEEIQSPEDIHEMLTDEDISIIAEECEGYPAQLNLKKSVHKNDGGSATTQTCESRF
ncbi:unnamed protein product [Diabrotica balteata]|uniref:UHRF1 tandem tudor domain-containing protein n=1 Tax=Diabrotica balteata TaxID=107213 RepID=A0A9N9XAU8_DIABA|nr:unnamed protein product [Diabrotica balteata]